MLLPVLVSLLISPPRCPSNRLKTLQLPHLKILLIIILISHVSPPRYILICFFYEELISSPLHCCCGCCCCSQPGPGRSHLLDTTRLSVTLSCLALWSSSLRSHRRLAHLCVLPRRVALLLAWKTCSPPVPCPPHPPPLL